MALLRRSPLLTVRALAALGLVLSLLVACSPSAPDEQTPTTTAGPDARTVGVTALLDSWTAALRSDDEAALRELIDSDADPGFADREIARAQALRGLPLSDFGY